MKKTILLFSIFLITKNCFAVGTSVGVVSSYLVSIYGKLFFHAGDANSRATCSNGDWAVDLIGPNAAAGKGILAAVISANAQGKTVHVYGTGLCDVWGDRETVEYIVVEN
jgi:hypothetical protein